MSGSSQLGVFQLGSAQLGAVDSGGAATAITLSGPSSGINNVASTNFTVGANGTITGTVIFTPTSSAGTGSFTPTTVSISAGTPTATFTYTPTSVGARNINGTNNGGLTAPANVAYTSNAAATAITLSGPSSGNNNAASTNFTVGADGVISGTVIVTPTDSSGSGSFSPTTVSISAGSPTGTFTYTPTTVGARNINATNNGGLAAPSNVVYTSNAPPATVAFSLTMNFALGVTPGAGFGWRIRDAVAGSWHLVTDWNAAGMVATPNMTASGTQPAGFTINAGVPPNNADNSFAGHIQVRSATAGAIETFELNVQANAAVGATVRIHKISSVFYSTDVFTTAGSRVGQNVAGVDSWLETLQTSATVNIPITESANLYGRDVVVTPATDGSFDGFIQWSEDTALYLTDAVRFAGPNIPVVAGGGKNPLNGMLVTR